MMMMLAVVVLAEIVPGDGTWWVLLLSLSLTICPYDGSWLSVSTLYTINLERSLGILTSDKPETDKLAFRTFIL